MDKINIILCLLMFFSCVQNKKKTDMQDSDFNSVDVPVQISITTDNLKEIQLDPYDKGYMYDDLIDSVSFIKLQTTNDNLMAYVNKIFFTEDKIIIVDYAKLKAIFVYNYKGDFLYKISRRGLGPDEYRTLDYAMLSLDKSQVVALDMGANKLKYFSVDGNIAKTTGSYLVKSENLPFIFTNVEFLTDDIIAGYYSGGNKVPGVSDLHLFILSDFKKNVYYSGYKSYYSSRFTYTTECPLQRFGSTLYFNPSFNDTIFVVKEGGLDARYVLNIRNHKKITIDEKTTDDEFRKILRSNSHFNSYFLDLSDVAIFNYEPNLGRRIWGLYVKSENKTYNCNGYFKNCILANCHEQSFYYKKNILVKPVSASWLLLNKERILKTWKSPSAKELFENLTEDDNPVLLFYHMKTKIE